MGFVRAILRFKLILSIVAAIVVAAFLTVRGCGGNITSGGPVLHPIGNTDNPNRRGDVVFVHGLDGHHRLTWGSEDESKFYWPKALSEDFPDIGFWSVEYATNSSEWLGGSMPIEDRSINLLELYRLKGIGEKPLIFVTHSLGGLVTKQVVLDAVTMDLDKWEGIATNSKGVVFLATPHAGSSIATYLERLGNLLMGAKLYRSSVQTRQLERNSSMLRSLGNKYKQIAKDKIQTLAFFENERVGGAVPVVDQDSADPGMTDVITTGIDADHLSICKPESREDLVYLSVADFIKSVLKPPPKDINLTFAQFLEQYHNAKKQGGDALTTFKDDYFNRRVTWDAVVDSRFPADGDDKPFLIIRQSAGAPDKVYAVFELDTYPASISPGTKISIAGTFAESTSPLGIVLTDCEMIRVLD